MIFIIRALSLRGKDDEGYDSPTSRDETSDFIKIKEAKEAHEKQKRPKKPTKKKRKKRKKKKKIKRKKRKRKNKMREKKKGQCYYLFSTLVLQSSTMIFMLESLICCHFHILLGIFHYRTWLL